jgi:hypothetical protein
MRGGEECARKGDAIARAVTAIAAASGTNRFCPRINRLIINPTSAVNPNIAKDVTILLAKNQE